VTNQALNQLKSLYSQLFNLIEETKELVAKGLTNDAAQKSTQIKNITKQLKFATKGTAIPDKNKEEIKALEIKAAEEIKSTMEALIQIKNNLKNSLAFANNDKKLKQAYSSDIPQLGQTVYEEE